MKLKAPPKVMSKIHEKRLQTFVSKNLIKDATPNEVYACHEKLYEYIMSFDNIETRKGYLQTLIDSLKRVDKSDVVLIQKYATEAYELTKQTKENYSTNTPSKKYDMTYDKLCSVMNELTERFNSVDTTTREHNLLISLNMNLRHPPLRSEICDMAFVDLNKSPEFEFKNDANYLIKNKNAYHIKLHKYKTKGIYGVKTIEITNENLIGFLDKSFEKAPRQYLLANESPDKPLNYKNYLSVLKWGLGPGIGCDAMRSIYISEFMKSEPSMKAKQELADKMGHSVASQQLFYLKVKNGDKTVLPKPIQDI